MSSIVTPLSFGFSWFLMFASSVAMALPLGTPPAAADPLMLRVAPEECLYFINWSGRGKADGASQNATERLLAEPEIQQFETDVLQTLRKTMAQIAAQSQTAEAKVVADVVPLLVGKVLQGPGTFYLRKAELTPTGLVVDAGVLLAVGDQGPPLNIILTRFVQQVLQRATGEVRIEGKPFRTLDLGGGIPVITWGLHGQYLVVGLGKGSVEGILKRAQTPQPKWLTEVLQRWPLKRTSTVAYADMEKLLVLLMSMTSDGSGQKVAQLLGFNNVKTYRSVSGLDGNQFASYSAITVDGKLQGALSLLDAPSLTPADLAGVPSDALAAFSFRMNGLQVYDLVENTFKAVDERGYQQLLRSLGELEEMIGGKIREDLVASLGTNWSLYTSPDTGGWITGWLLTVDIKDQDRLLQVRDSLQKKITKMLSEGGPRRALFGVNRSTFLGQDIVVFTNGFNPLSLAVTDKQLLLSAYPQAVKAHLKRQQVTGAKSLSSSPRLAPLFRNGQGPQAVQYLNLADALRMAYPALQVGLRAVCSELQRDGWEITMAHLPSLDSLLRHLQPSLASVHRVEDGIEFRVSQTIPSNGLSLSAPVVVAALLPAVSAARDAARRAAGANNLKQIGLAMHNFHDSYGGFPAAYSTDKNGKPLLSWRVHILPFVEGQALYRQFKLDEPWDSPHNKKLIARMPAVYAAAGSLNSPGKTNYLAIRTGQAVMAPPAVAMRGKKNPLGSRFRDITDGTSNTAMVVESSDAKSVIWTKPDDLVPDVKDPAKGIRGLRRNGFWVLLSDGSVRFLSDRIDPRVLKAVFTRNGGEAFGNDQLR